MSEDVIKYILSEIERYCTWSQTFRNPIEKEYMEWLNKKTTTPAKTAMNGDGIITTMMTET